MQTTKLNIVIEGSADDYAAMVAQLVEELGTPSKCSQRYPSDGVTGCAVLEYPTTDRDAAEDMIAHYYPHGDYDVRLGFVDDHTDIEGAVMFMYTDDAPVITPDTKPNREEK